MSTEMSGEESLASTTLTHGSHMGVKEEVKIYQKE